MFVRTRRSQFQAELPEVTALTHQLTSWRRVSLHNPTVAFLSLYLGVLISSWLFLLPIFLFAAQPKDFFMDRLKKLEQRSHKCVELRGEYVE
jgi:hypothetical protein